MIRLNTVAIVFCCSAPPSPCPAPPCGVSCALLSFTYIRNALRGRSLARRFYSLDSLLFTAVAFKRCVTQYPVFFFFCCFHFYCYFSPAIHKQPVFCADAKKKKMLLMLLNRQRQVTMDFPTVWTIQGILVLALNYKSLQEDFNKNWCHCQVTREAEEQHKVCLWVMHHLFSRRRNREWTWIMRNI